MHNTTNKAPVLVPPRLLAGITLLYWGAMTGEAIVALLIAILLEGKNWVKFSWDFDDASYVKAFQASLGILGTILLFVWLEEIGHNSLFQVIKWFPLCFLPVELAQRYGKRDRINLNTFFYFSRQRMRQDLKEGRAINPQTINTGYPYLFIVIVVASCASKMNIYVHMSLLILFSIILLSVSVKRGLGWKRLTCAIPFMIGFVVWIQLEAAAIYKILAEGGSFHKAAEIGESNPHRSILGQLGKIKQSNDIQWRMWGDDVPKYLRLNSYNKHQGMMWSYDFKSDAENFETMDDAFESRLGDVVGDNESGLYVFEPEHKEIIERPDGRVNHVRLRGIGRSDTVESIVPAGEGFVAVSEMFGDDVKAAVHPLGVLKLINRKSVIDYKLSSVDDNLLDSDPDYLTDLQIFPKYNDALLSLSKEMGLSKHKNVKKKVNMIQGFFNREFTYSLHFDFSPGSGTASDLVRFMSNVRRGHCEYFATTATLLLRQQGVPARYCVGYVVREKSDDAWVMRGTHMHAWCSVWINGKWEIVDPTPPDWFSLENVANTESWAQWLKDRFNNLKQDFQVWKGSEENKEFLNMIIWILGAILLSWLSYRLFKARSKKGQLLGEGLVIMNGAYKVDQEMMLIEQHLVSVIGERARAQTYSSWVNSSKEKLDNALISPLREMLMLHEQSRFGGVDNSEKMSIIYKDMKSALKK